MFKSQVNLIPILLVGLLTGCASTFKAYPDQVNSLIAAVNEPKETFDKLVKTQIGKKAEQRDQVLYNMELGRLYQLRGDYEVSQHFYRKALDTIEARDQEAAVRTKDIANQAGALLTNDNAIPYKGYGFERVMLHQEQLRNYIELKDIDAALVEARRGILAQQLATDEHGRDLEKLEKKKEASLAAEGDNAKKKQEQLNLYKKSFDEGFAENCLAMDKITADVLNSFQNGATYYTSALLHESFGQKDNAYIDYKKAFELSPNNSFILNDILNLSKELKRPNDYSAYAKRLKGKKNKAPEKSQGELVVFFENGLIPARKEVKITLPNPELNLSSIAFPTYPARDHESQALSIRSGGGIVQTQPLADLRKLAIKNLREQVPAMATRQVLRLVAKEAVGRVAENQYGFLGKLGANAINTATERADLRSWMTLPDEIQMMRLSLPVGKQTVHFSYPDVSEQSLELNIHAGKITLVYVTRMGSVMYASSQLLHQEHPNIASATNFSHE